MKRFILKKRSIRIVVGLTLDGIKLFYLKSKMTSLRSNCCSKFYNFLCMKKQILKLYSQTYSSLVHTHYTTSIEDLRIRQFNIEAHLKLV